MISNEKLVIGTNLIPIIEIVGIRFTDKSFNVDLKLVQTLITNLDYCDDAPKSMFSGLINNDSLNKNVVVYDEIDKAKKSNGQMESEDLVVEKNKMKNIEVEKQIIEKECIDDKENNKEKTIDNNKGEVDEIEEVADLVPEEFKMNIEKNVKEVQESVEGSVKEVAQESVAESVEESCEGIIKRELKEDKSSEIPSVVEKKDSIEEIDIYGKIVDGDTPIKLKTHTDIYKEIWKMYRDEAFKVRQQNIKFMLNSKNVHTNFLINEI